MHSVSKSIQICLERNRNIPSLVKTSPELLRPKESRCAGQLNSPVFRYCQTKSVAKSFSSLTLNYRSNLVKQKIDELVAKYEQITGMDEVRIAQNRVIEAQDKFVLSQEKRREVVKELSDIQTKLKEVYAELDTTTRGEER